MDVFGAKDKTGCFPVC